MDIKVLTTGGCRCSSPTTLIQSVADELNVSVNVTDVHDLRQFAQYGVMNTPAVIVDGKVVHAGGQPTREQVRRWLAGVAAG